MGASPRYHLPKREECETSVEHGLPLWAEPCCRVLLAATAPFPSVGQPLCGGTSSRAVRG